MKNREDTELMVDVDEAGKVVSFYHPEQQNNSEVYGLGDVKWPRHKVTIDFEKKNIGDSAKE